MIRAAGLADVGTVARILSEFVDRTPWMPRIYTRAQDLAHVEMLISRGWVTVACRGGISGFLARDAEMVHALYVVDSAQCSGLGKALLDDAKSRCRRLSLWTFQANTGARRFYAREGFKEQTMTDGSGNDEGLPDVRLVWEKVVS